MGLWDDEAFRDKHEDEWKQYDYYDRYGWPDVEDEVHSNLDDSTKDLLSAFDAVGIDFYECTGFGDFVDYLCRIFEYFNGREPDVFGSPVEAKSEAECATIILNVLPAFIEDAEANIDDAPHFAEEFALEDLVRWAQEGVIEMQTIIDNGGIV